MSSFVSGVGGRLQCSVCGYIPQPTETFCPRCAGIQPVSRSPVPVSKGDPAIRAFFVALQDSYQGFIGVLIVGFIVAVGTSMLFGATASAAWCGLAWSLGLWHRIERGIAAAAKAE